MPLSVHPEATRASPIVAPPGAQLFGIGRECLAAKRGMRSCRVVGPGVDELPGLVEFDEQGLIEEFRRASAAQGLDTRIVRACSRGPPRGRVPANCQTFLAVRSA